MTTCLLSFLSGLLFINVTEAQTTWTGAIDQNWHNAANWTNGLPAPGNDAFIPDVMNDPVITSSTTFNYEVTITGTLHTQVKVEILMILSIQDNGTLIVDDSLLCSGEFTNQGVVEYGLIIIEDQGIFINFGIILGG